MFATFLLKNRGQSVVEYLVFFSAIVLLTLFSVCTLYPEVHEAAETAVEEAIGEIVGAD